ncbi:unnamed protein product [Rotaria sordida]|uniref:Sodium/calcium exchanger membrane region domain-containing protein n=1 Tax=Rotaria sordida TaxID=392033 RepID=A0A815DYC9_9BILA|nr:unnamed protein product [Rotaria sordida]
MSTEFVNLTTVSCQRFKCSGRGLILPFGIEACMSIQLRAVLYFIILIYLFLGIAIIAGIHMSAIETITSRKKKVRYPDPEEKDKYITVEVPKWNNIGANVTPEILLSIIEIIKNRFEAEELGPGTIIGSAAYKLLIICALCIVSINAPETRRIKLYNVFLVTSFFGLFAYIWLFIVLSLISKDVVDLWEATITFLMFPLVVILAYLGEKRFFASKEIDMEEEERKLILAPPELDETGTPRSFRKEELLQFLRDLDQSTNLSLEDKAQLFAVNLSESMPRSRMQYRIQGARMLTGGKSLFLNLPDRLQEIYNAVKERNSIKNGRRRQIPEEIDQQPTVEFTATAYGVLERE